MGRQMDTEAAPWTSLAIRQFWNFGLDLWAARNQMVHGNTGGPSIRDQTRVEATVRVLFRDLRPTITYQMREIFDRSEDEMVQIPYQNQVAWIE